ncbi:hypothetical protein [Roseibium sediminicola]|uniref:Transposase n=1 Tax=Roseibium sediminicola TaxID=2933272 RepID=A0ABT0H0L2_9HYPH|nr:hypothetical protein [Roseibium sp. CAU 1639]MCK7615000.1 hypothetical protein [Roseibium sp. CAU 1639]
MKINRPSVSRGTALFHASQHLLARFARAVRQLEQRQETLRPSWQGRCVRGLFSILAGLDEGAHLIAMFDSTVIRAHVSAAGAKGGRKVKRSGVRAAGSAPKSI